MSVDNSIVNYLLSYAKDNKKVLFLRGIVPEKRLRFAMAGIFFGKRFVPNGLVEK